MSNQMVRFQPVDASMWSVMRDQAQVLVKTGFLPESIRTPKQALAIMMKGSELGVPPMHALSNIAVIKGKPVCGAELLLALIYRDHGDNAIKVLHTDNQRCVVAYRRRAWTEAEQFEFSMQEAKTAGITNNPTWTKYPQAMLRARCISAVARMAFADSIGGMYTPEELGAAVTVDSEGAVVLDAAPAIEVAPMPTKDQVEEIKLLNEELFSGLTGALTQHLRPFGKSKLRELTPDEAEQLINKLRGMVLEKEAAKAMDESEDEPGEVEGELLEVAA
jgi:hypothetical protein